MESNKKRRGFMKGKLMPFYNNNNRSAPKSSSNNIQYSTKVVKPSQSCPSMGFVVHHHHHHQVAAPAKQTNKVSFMVPSTETKRDKIYACVAVDEAVDFKAASYISSVQQRFRLETINSERIPTTLTLISDTT
ncbi:hypothetical protein M5689_009195 [Euphorbia peplus]|nr:hypothetical protein M5689_009195 [Euphorbia peplus]